jgi:hypothetical protein
MAALIPYLKGGESASASYMNALFGALDAKLTAILSGKSFFLAQELAMPVKFCGKIFCFTSGTPLYAGRAPAVVSTAYNHAPFTAAAAAFASSVSPWDETNKIAIIPEVASSYYTSAGVPQELGVRGYPISTFFDWSLEAHHYMHQGSNDTAPVPYYIQEAQIVSSPLYLCPIHPPEKHLRFALAEIVIEGPTSVTLPANYDKYSCFRVHNLNSVAVTVNFGGAYTLTLQPFQTACVRRDSPTANYRRSAFNYFFQFEGGDPRFYWFMPTICDVGNYNEALMATGSQVSNSMQANNLSNPACLHDWVQYFLRDMSTWGGVDNAAVDRWYAGWQQDPSIQCDIHPLYPAAFGDPGNPATLLGDLLHHQGKIVIKRTATVPDPITGIKAETWDSVQFNGYTTIVADFAAKLLTVAPNSAGDLVITNADTNNDVLLIPIGTNMFKSFTNAGSGVTGTEVHPSSIALAANTPSSNFTIENAIFENPNYQNLTATPAQQIFQPALATATNQRTWTQVTTYPVSGPLVGTPVVVSGPDSQTLDWTHARATAKTLHGIHQITVAQILQLDWWGDPAAGNQQSTYVSISKRSLQLTPEGLVLLYIETDSTIQPVSGGTGAQLNNWAAAKIGLPICKQIKFRSHGWGYVSAENGSLDTGFLSPQFGRYLCGTNFTGEILAPAGADFSLPTLSVIQNSIQVLTKIRTGDLSHVQGGRFWQTNAPGGDSLDTFVEGSDTPIATPAPIAMALLAEMYNAMARAVNAITSGCALSWRTLRWNITTGSVTKTVSLSGAAGDWGLLPLANRTRLQGKGTWNAATNTPDITSGPTVGDYYQVSIAGTFAGKSFSIGDYAYYNGTAWLQLLQAGPQDGSKAYTLPMAAFTVFNPGSDYAALCTLLSIPVNSVLPGGLDTAGDSQPFSYFVSKQIVPAMIETTFTWNGGAFACSSVDSYGNFTATGTFTSSWSATLLSAADTKSRWPTYPGAVGVTLDGTSLGGFPALEWCALNDVRAAVEALGFHFSYQEIVIPLALEYWEDPCSISMRTIPGNLNQSQVYNTSLGDCCNSPAVFLSELIAYCTGPQSSVSDSAAGFNSALLKFVQTTDSSKALWKTILAGAPPITVFSAQVRNLHSPIYTWDATGVQFFTWEKPVALDLFVLTVGTVPSVLSQMAEYGIEFQPTVRNASDFLQMTETDGSIFDQLNCFAINIVASSGLTVFSSPVLLVGSGFWSIQTDYWGLGTVERYSEPAAGFSPWIWVSAPANKIIPLAPGLNIISPGAQNVKYSACFNLTQALISLGDSASSSDSASGSTSASS